MNKRVEQNLGGNSCKTLAFSSKGLSPKIALMEKLHALTHFVQDAEKGFSWLIEENGGHVENVVTDIIKDILEKGRR